MKWFEFWTIYFLKIIPTANEQESFKIENKKTTTKKERQKLSALEPQLYKCLLSNFNLGCPSFPNTATAWKVNNRHHRPHDLARATAADLRRQVVKWCRYLISSCRVSHCAIVNYYFSITSPTYAGGDVRLFNEAVAVACGLGVRAVLAEVFCEASARPWTVQERHRTSEWSFDKPFNLLNAKCHFPILKGFRKRINNWKFPRTYWFSTGLR